MLASLASTQDKAKDKEKSNYSSLLVIDNIDINAIAFYARHI